MSYIYYDGWLLEAKDRLQKLCQCTQDLRASDSDFLWHDILKNLYISLIDLKDAQVTIDFGELESPVFVCKKIEVNNRDAYQICCMLKGTPTLVLYLNPNITSCPRYMAFVHYIETILFAS